MHYSNMIDANEELAMIEEDKVVAGAQQGGSRAVRFREAYMIELAGPFAGTFYREVFDDKGRRIGKAMVPNLEVVNKALDIRDHNKLETYVSMGYPVSLDFWAQS
jgi:hypothetical protein